MGDKKIKIIKKEKWYKDCFKLKTTECQPLEIGLLGISLSDNDGEREAALISSGKFYYSSFYSKERSQK